MDGTFLLADAENGREPRLDGFRGGARAPARDILEPAQPYRSVFLPRPLRLVETLPRNATGKLPRGGLLRLLQETEEKEAME